MHSDCLVYRLKSVAAVTLVLKFFFPSGISDNDRTLTQAFFGNRSSKLPFLERVLQSWIGSLLITQEFTTFLLQYSTFLWDISKSHCARRPSGFIKVIRFNVLLLGVYNPLEIPVEIETDVGWIGVAGVADLCQVLNNETSAYSKLFIPCRLHCCCDDKSLLKAKRSKHCEM